MNFGENGPSNRFQPQLYSISPAWLCCFFRGRWLEDYIGAPKVSSYRPYTWGLRVRGVLRRSGGPERLISIGQASRVIYRRFKSIVLFNSRGGLGTVVEESMGEEGYVVWLLA